jgi:hypothetical protein
MNNSLFSRPFLVWAIIIFLVYGILATCLNFYSSWTGGISYSAFQIVFGLLSVAANFWLLYQVWFKRPSQVFVAYVNAAILLLLYGLMAIGELVRGDTENFFAALFLGGFSVGIWVAIGLYLRRIKATK